MLAEHLNKTFADILRLKCKSSARVKIVSKKDWVVKKVFKSWKKKKKKIFENFGKKNEKNKKNKKKIEKKKKLFFFFFFEKFVKSQHSFKKTDGNDHYRWFWTITGGFMT